ncbi:hypothetical protein [Stenotrophomonas sp. 9(2022)]|nr:hypothetical protein [Stenotrophomonas sp. 9(2022)]
MGSALQKDQAGTNHHATAASKAGTACYYDRQHEDPHSQAA